MTFPACERKTVVWQLGKLLKLGPEKKGKINIRRLVKFYNNLQYSILRFNA
jgi:hypothetical protein